MSFKLSSDIIKIVVLIMHIELVFDFTQEHFLAMSERASLFRSKYFDDRIIINSTTNENIIDVSLHRLKFWKKNIKLLAAPSLFYARSIYSLYIPNKL